MLHIVLAGVSSVTTASFAIENPFVESVASLDGVCDLDGTFEEHRDDGLEFKFSKGISSDIGREMRGLDSLDFGVPECERSRCLVPVGVLIGVLDGFAEELLWRCSLSRKKKYRLLIKIKIFQ